MAEGPTTSYSTTMAEGPVHFTSAVSWPSPRSMACDAFIIIRSQAPPSFCAIIMTFDLWLATFLRDVTATFLSMMDRTRTYECTFVHHENRSSREARITLISTDLDFSVHIVAIVVAVICIATPQDRRLSFHNLDRRLKHS